MTRTLTVTLFLLTPVLALAEVADVSANGFTVKTTLNVQASPVDVYRKLVHNVGDWWDSNHTFSGDAHNLTIEEKPGGCLCEKLPDGGFGQGAVRHMEVVYFAPGSQLVLKGALGPLQALAATGTLTVMFTPVDQGTRLEVTYAVLGYLAAGMNKWAAPVDGVIKEQFTRLKDYAEHGDSAQAGKCESLSSVSIPGATFTKTETVAAGAFPAPPGRGPNAGAVYKSLPAFCRVAATLKPSSDSDIRIEVWMPAGGWNGKLESVGNGAWAGTISYPAMATALANGYAAASTDTGHIGNNPEFILGHPEKVIDFAYRSVHELTVASKAIIAAYYSSGPKYSYWNGCSTGGKQALTEAQRFPNDYDGIVAGAPANYTTRLQGSQVWTSAMTHKDEAGYIPPAKYAVIHKAALDQCDALDGVKDGVIEDPTRCKFDPSVLECKGGDAPSCLTAPQVALAKKIYAGPGFFPGLEPGSEMGWATLSGPKPMDLAVDTYKYLVFQDPTWDYLQFDSSKHVAQAEKTISGVMDGVNPDLRPLFSHGGKLLQYHGWADPGIAPGSSVNYHKSVLEALGGQAKVSDSYRLFMVPGMGHCGGGDGTSTFDMVSALDQWVVQGKAPDQIVASRVVNGAVVRTRPLCPFPQVATYKGQGSTDDAANFSCKLPK